MSERTLEDALARAKSLRDFKVTNYERFERCPDFWDLVTLADEVERLGGQVSGLIEFAAEARGTAQAERAIERTYSDDESW